MNLFWDEVIEHGGEIVGVESYGLDQTDFIHPIKNKKIFFVLFFRLFDV